MDKVFIIAEIGLNANGSLDTAKKLISAAHFAGADMVKFQKRTIEKCYTKEFLDSYRESPWGTTQREQKYGLEFSFEDYCEIDEFCRTLHIQWSASAWDLDSVDFLETFNLPHNKIASAMLTNIDILLAVAAQQKHTFISTGLSYEKEVDFAVKIFKDHQCPFTLMHTIGVYPCPVHELRLQYIRWLKKYGAPVGYSGHEVGLSTTLAAVAMGAVAVERHITLDRSAYGSDQAASVEPYGFKRLVDSIREIEQAIKDGYGPRETWEIEKVVAEKLRYWEVKNEP